MMQANLRSGQSLLIIVLLIAIVFTVIASASYRLTTETQSAKAQEETIRTLAAADSGIEKGLQQLNSLTTHDEYTFSTLGIGLPGIDAAESTVTVTSTGGQNFVSPLVKKDSQYTFYLSDYPFGSNYYTGSDLYIYFGGSSSGCGTAGNNGADRTLPAIEITTLTNTNTVSRTIVEPCTSFTHRIQNTTITGTSVTAPQQIFSGYTFRQRYLYTLPANTRLLVVRPIFGETYVGFYTNNPNISFPIQGKTITSTAISTTGISKTVTLFRSNPQLPADFFVTSF